MASNRKRRKKSGDDAVPVADYTRTRFGKREHIKRHGRGPRAKSPGGYRKRRKRR